MKGCRIWTGTRDHSEQDVLLLEMHRKQLKPWEMSVGMLLQGSKVVRGVPRPSPRIKLDEPGSRGVWLQLSVDPRTYQLTGLRQALDAGMPYDTRLQVVKAVLEMLADLHDVGLCVPRLRMSDLVLVDKSCSQVALLDVTRIRPLPPAAARARKSFGGDRQEVLDDDVVLELGGEELVVLLARIMRLRSVYGAILETAADVVEAVQAVLEFRHYAILHNLHISTWIEHCLPLLVLARGEAAPGNVLSAFPCFKGGDERLMCVAHMHELLKSREDLRRNWNRHAILLSRNDIDLTGISYQAFKGELLESWAAEMEAADEARREQIERAAVAAGSSAAAAASSAAAACPASDSTCGNMFILGKSRNFVAHGTQLSSTRVLNFDKNFPNLIMELMVPDNCWCKPADVDHHDQARYCCQAKVCEVFNRK